MSWNNIVRKNPDLSFSSNYFILYSDYTEDELKNIFN